jgi:1-phosphofructokinase
MSEAGSPLELPFGSCSVAVFAPSPVVTITVEAGSESEPDIHLHAGGQGFWVARMAARLGAKVSLCVPLGGESGTVLRSLLAVEGISVLSVETQAANGAYIHDRRGGSRVVVAETSSPPLTRHELDDLYGVTLAAGMESDVALITGTRNPGILSAEVYERLCRDLRTNGRMVAADLSGEPLTAAVRGGVDFLKVSDEDLLLNGRMKTRGPQATAEVARALCEGGAANVLVSRSSEPAILLTGDRELEVDGPHFEPVDEHGAGDSLFAGIGVGIGGGLPMEAAVKLGVAAGALNVARHGLGTGHLREVASLCEQVRFDPLQVGGADSAARSAASTAS